MKGSEFVRHIKRLGKDRGIPVRFDPRTGKGSHGRLHYGERFTTVKGRGKEISPGLQADMLRQLGLRPSDLAQQR